MHDPRFAAVLALTALTSLAALACGKSDNKSDTTSTTQGATGAKVDMAAAQAMFNERCAACHGTEGKGNGPGAVALNPKPRNYTDKAWQASVTDEQIKKTIKLGGAGVGKSPIMPASPDLDEKPEVVEGLVQIVRRFGR